MTSVEAPPAPTASRAVRALAVVGALLVALQAWGYAGWLLADVPLGRDGAGVPADVRASVVRAEVLMVVSALGWVTCLVVTTRRRGWPTWPLVLSVAWALVYWQESLVNLTERRFTYNPYFLSRGDWVPHLPLSRVDEPMLDQPLLMEALVFVWLIPAVGVAVAALLRVLSRWTTSVPVLVVVACLVTSGFETAFELSGISQQLLVWNRVPEGLALREGTVGQWPLTELPLGFVWALPGILWHLRDRTPALAWLDPDPEPDLGPGPGAGERTLGGLVVRVLALTAVINLAFLAYNLTLALVPATVGADFPGWLQG